MARKKIGTPVSYPPGHPYNDPRKRAADAVGMLEALAPRYSPPRGSYEEKRAEAKELIGFMWAIEGREITMAEALKMVGDD
jgi:hypothetical protein